ncbi:MAG TPA: biotin--[acetyl-CoA-carboxylase] ligase [Caulobacteraceae bacterium]|jgi:BirA family biotin operon repressor/biotin-[acetyl-CoA-carboxylase] ligase|nr:biotin--[acetyl-CoA-carboxylase] ligase [Caulobacteraceae bacterium]
MIWLEEVDSTNAEARRYAHAGETGPVWIAARRQTQGRGRRGRKWTTGEGNLAATLLTVTALPAAQAAGAAFVAALAASDLASAYVPPGLVTLKWPNDVLVARRKACGILVETGPALAGGIWLAVGVGVNLVSAPHDAERPATALADHLGPGRSAPPTPDQALVELAAAYGRWNAVWEAGGLAPILEAWTARAPGIPGACIARLPDGTLRGTAEGLDSDGALRLRLADESLRRITAGDVFFGDR